MSNVIHPIVRDSVERLQMEVEFSLSIVGVGRHGLCFHTLGIPRKSGDS